MEGVKLRLMGATQPLASPRQAPCTPRRRLAAALAMDKEFYAQRAVKVNKAAPGRQRKRQILYRAGKKIGDTYALVTVLLSKENELDFVVHVPETCMEYRVKTRHPRFDVEPRANQVHIAQVLVDQLHWRVKGQLAFADVLRLSEESKR